MSQSTESRSDQMHHNDLAEEADAVQEALKRLGGNPELLIGYSVVRSVRMYSSGVPLHRISNH